MILGEGVAGFEEEAGGGIGMTIEGAIETLMGGIVVLISVSAITAAAATTTTTMAVVITRIGTEIGIGIGIGTGMGCLGLGGVDLEVPLREGMEGLRLVRLSCPLVPAIEVA